MLPFSSGPLREKVHFSLQHLLVSAHEAYKGRYLIGIATDMVSLPNSYIPPRAVSSSDKNY